MRCSYGLCNSDSRYRHKDYMKGVEFILFPKAHENLEKCKIWVHACGRKNFTVKNVTLHTYMCTKHFDGGKGPTKEHPHPIPLTLVNVTTKKRQLPFSERSSHKKILLESLSGSESEDRGEKPCASSSKQSEFELSQETDSSSTMDNTSTLPIKLFNDRSTQTLGEQYVRQLFTNIEKKRSAAFSEDAQFYKITYANLRCDNEKFKFFTGFSVEMFETLYEFLDPIKISRLKYKCNKPSPKIKSNVGISLADRDKLLLILIRLRRGFTFQELAYFFEISSSMASRITYTWIQYMYFEFKKFKDVMFQTRYSQKSKLPCFKPFKNLRVIVDCTEILIQMPKNFKDQGNTFSSYKNHNSIKFLVGISTSGAIIYVSDGYEGCQTDDAIFEDLISYMVPGDVIMAYRGFNVQDKLNAIRAEIIIPPFLKDRKKLTAQEEILTKRIARARIHVERVKKKIKDYRIFNKILQNKLLPVVSQMFYIVCCLVNFENSLV